MQPLQTAVGWGIAVLALPLLLHAQESEHPPEDDPVIAGAPSEQRVATSKSGWLPEGRLFAPRAADLQEPGFRAAYLHSDLLDPKRLARERPALDLSGVGGSQRTPMGAVALGGSFPVWRRTGIDGTAVQVAVDAGATARFRLDTSSQDMLASDWVAGVMLEGRRGRATGRLRIFHRSAHLGDELMEEIGVGRLSFDFEGVSLDAAWELTPRTRIYGGATGIFRSTTAGFLQSIGRHDRDRGGVQAGIEVQVPPGLEGRFSPVVALDLRVDERTGWEPLLSALAGVEVRVGQRHARVAARFLSGPSGHGQFFLDPETALGLELALSP